MGRPKQHNEETAQVLLDAAEAIVASDGPDGLSVRRVAERAGTSTRAVYSLFDSKEGLIAALGNRAFDILGSRGQEIVWTDDPARDLAEAAVRNFRGWALEHPGLFRIVFQRAEVSPAVAARFRPAQMAALSGLVDLVSRAMGLDGGLANPVVREAVAKFDAMCEGLALLELRGALAPDRAEQVWRDGIAALISGMRSADSGQVQTSQG